MSTGPHPKSPVLPILTCSRRQAPKPPRIGLGEVVLSSAVLALGLACASTKQGARELEPRELPVFRLGPARVDGRSAETLAQKLFNASASAEKSAKGFRAESQGFRVDVCAVSGGVWAADRSRLWKPDQRPQLPSEQEALKLAQAAADVHALLPNLTASGFLLGAATTSATHAAIERPLADGRWQRNHRLLDRSVTWPVMVNISQHAPAGGMQTLPIVGGGGEFNLALGEAGRIIGWSGTWRPVEGVQEVLPVIPREQCDKQFLDLTKGMTLASYRSRLAYYSAPRGQAQSALYPVRVYSAVALVDDHQIPLREIILPATSFGPAKRPQDAVEPRAKDARPQRRSTMPEGEEEAGKQLEGQKNYMLLGDVAAEPVPATWMECGTSFIGESGGLSGSFDNANGFVDELSAAGWSVNFNWGDDAAWESDWNRNDDEWVDTADFVFYTGHADMNGWMLSDPDDTKLHFNEVDPRSPRDLWGSQDLEWAVIAACGPLQDEVLAKGGGNVFDRWRDAFDGLHQLLGYGAVTFDNEEEGRRLAELCLNGETVIDAWFQTAKEIQPSTNGYSAPDGPKIWVGVVYAVEGGADPGEDHIWGEGSVSSDPVDHTVRVAMWTGT